MSFIKQDWRYSWRTFSRAQKAFVVIWLILPASVPFSAESAPYKRYGHQSGIIHYTRSGSVSGTETVYFDRWGMREARYASAQGEVSGKNIQSEILTVMDEEWIYQANLTSKIGTKVPNIFVQELKRVSSSPDLYQTGEKLMLQNGGKRMGSNQVLGLECDLWLREEYQQSSCLAGGIPLKSSAQVDDFVLKVVAEKIELDVDIPEEKFQLPSDIQITDASTLPELPESGDAPPGETA